MIVTPGQLKSRAELYHQLSSLISAGVSFPEAVEMARKNPPCRSFREPLGRLSHYVQDGYTVGESFEKLGSWMPSFDLALLRAGDESGRADTCFKLLAGYYEERAQLIRAMIGDLMYPAFVFHFAIVIFPFIKFFQDGNLFRFLLSTLGVFVPLYALVFLIIWACQGKRGELWRGMVETVLHPIPILGRARRELALARLSAALEALIQAGVRVIEAWSLAAAASGSPALVRTVATWKKPLENGQTPAEMVSQSRQFPEAFSSLYHTGEISGRMDQTLQRLHSHFQEEATRRMRLLAQMTPRLVYFIIAILVAIKVVSFYTNLYSGILGGAGAF